MCPSGVPTLTINSGIFLVHRDLDAERSGEVSTFARENARTAWGRRGFRCGTGSLPVRRPTGRPLPRPPDGLRTHPTLLNCMGPMALFQSEITEVIKKLANKSFATQEERDEMLARVEAADGLRGKDLVWMLFRPDRAIRESGARALARALDPETVDAFLAETKNKPDQAMRAAAAALFSLPITGIDARLTQLLAAPSPLQEGAKRLLLEAPVAGGIEQLLWQQAAAGSAGERLPLLNKLA